MVMDMRKSGISSTADSGSYSDLNRLNQLKVGADKNSEGNMRKVAQEFESLFLSEMLKSMRSATEALGKDNPLNTPAAKQYQEMYDSNWRSRCPARAVVSAWQTCCCARCRRTSR